MQQLSGAFRNLYGGTKEVPRGTQGSVPVPADAACAQLFPFFSARSCASRPAFFPALALRDMSETFGLKPMALFAIVTMYTNCKP